MSVTPKSSWPWVKALLHSVYDQPDTPSVHAQFDRIVDALDGKLPAVAETAPASSAWSAQCGPSSTTNVQKPAATSASTSSPDPKLRMTPRRNPTN
jgi:hypothetical protein